MKRVLLGTTAVVGLGLLFPAPVFAAEPMTLGVSGGVRIEANFVNQDDEGTTGSRNFQLRLDDASFALTGRGEADNGLVYGAKISFDADSAGQAITRSESGLWFSGGWGRIELGNDDGAEDGMGYHGGDINSGASGYDGGISTAFDFNSATVTGPGLSNDSGDATKITYFTPRINGIQVGVSYTPDTGAQGTASLAANVADAAGVQDHIGLGINFVQSFDDVGIAVAYVLSYGDAEDNSTRDTNSWSVGGKVDFGNISVAAGYGDAGDSAETAVERAVEVIDDKRFADFTVRYSDGPMTVSAGYFSGSASVAGDDDDEVDIFSVGVAYSVAPGLSVHAGFDIISVDQDGTALDNDGTLLTIGTKMSF